MKFLVVLIVAALAIAQTLATGAADIPEEQEVSIDESLRAKKSAYGGSSYGGSSYSAPPCPQNYLFSCQPHLKPVGCAQSSYGSAGAYSEHKPQYLLPQPRTYLTNNYGRQGFY